MPAKYTRWWPWPPLTRKELVAGLCCAAALIVLLVALVRFPMFGRASTGGFGPDWDCTHLPKTEPVCVKRVPAEPAANSQPRN